MISYLPYAGKFLKPNITCTKNIIVIRLHNEDNCNVFLLFLIKGADVVIAMTHMRWPNDRKLAEKVDNIDIILGGHDHDYGVEQVKHQCCLILFVWGLGD